MRKTRKRLIERIIEIDYHRNGISGAPFHAVRFTHIDDAGERRYLLATVFEEKGAVAVLATDRLLEQGVAFGVNSWRGDQFEPELRKAIEAHELGTLPTITSPGPSPLDSGRGRWTVRPSKGGAR